MGGSRGATVVSVKYNKTFISAATLLICNYTALVENLVINLMLDSHVIL